MSEDIQNIVEKRNCHHGEPCVILTKLKPNSQGFGKSIFSCERQRKCGYKAVANVPLQKCSLHDNYIMFRRFREEGDTTVIRYYCSSHANNEWCGIHKIVPSEDQSHKDKENVSPKGEKEATTDPQLSTNNPNLKREWKKKFTEGNESDNGGNSTDGEDTDNISTEGEESNKGGYSTEGPASDVVDISTEREELDNINISTKGEESDVIDISTEGEESDNINISTEGEESDNIDISTKGEESDVIDISTKQEESTKGEESDNIDISTEGEESDNMDISTEDIVSTEANVLIASSKEIESSEGKGDENCTTDENESSTSAVQACAPDQEKQLEFQVGFQFRTLLKQLADIQILIARHGPYLPDKGARLKADEHAIKQRMLKLRGYIPSQEEIIEHLNKPSTGKQDQEPSVKQKTHSKALHGYSKQLTHGAVESLHSSLDSCPGEDVFETDPDHLKVQLFSYQKRALAWLLWREQQVPKGGILADDMGLGKTLSMISLILKTLPRQLPLASQEGLLPVKATLVVVPLTLLGMWAEEIKSKVAGNRLSVLVYHGPKRTKDHRDFQYYDVVLTTYSLVTNEAADLIAAETNKPSKKKGSVSDTLFRVEWIRVILDEAHNIRNSKAGCSIGCCGLHAVYRWAMTGTPIQNKLEDFYSLIKFLRLSPFNDLRVWKDCISNRSSIGMQRLKTMVSSLVLRRTKGEMEASKKLSLPNKSLTQHEVILDGMEKKIYDIIFHEGREFFKRYLTEQGEYYEEEESSVNKTTSLLLELPPTVANAVKKILGFLTQEDEVLEKSSKGRMVLVLLLRLRQACSHLNLLCSAFDKDENTIADDMDLNLAMGAISLNQPTTSNHHVMASDVPYEFGKQRTSAKIKTIVCELERILSSTDSNSRLPNKCIIVSQWTSMLDLLDYHLTRRDISFTRIDGKVPAKMRQICVEKFNSINQDPSVMLLSLTAGGVGLTLTGANHVFIVDLHWNPQLEEQAADRCHRVGQTRDVLIHRFIVKDTIEIGIQVIQQTKLELARQVLSGRRAKTALTLADLKQLFEIN